MDKIYGGKTMESKYQKKTFEPVRYQMITVYDDNCSKSEGTNDIVAALETAAIYLRDSTCCCVKIWDDVRNEWILDYWAD